MNNGATVVTFKVNVPAVLASAAIKSTVTPETSAVPSWLMVNEVVSPGANGATLIFDVYVTLWSSNYSSFYFKANGNNEVHYYNSTNNGTWITEVVSLNPNTRYELEWFLDAYGSGDNTQAAYIDDVKLLGDVSVLQVDSEILLNMGVQI